MFVYVRKWVLNSAWTTSIIFSCDDAERTTECRIPWTYRKRKSLLWLKLNAGRQLVNGQWTKWSVFKWVTWVMSHCTLTYDILRYSTYAEVFIRITVKRQQIGQIRLKGLTCMTEWFIFFVVLPVLSNIECIWEFTSGMWNTVWSVKNWGRCICVILTG